MMFITNMVTYADLIRNEQNPQKQPMMLQLKMAAVISSEKLMSYRGTF